MTVYVKYIIDILTIFMYYYTISNSYQSINNEQLYTGKKGKSSSYAKGSSGKV